MGFVHLHVHTQYSIQDSVNKIGDCLARVKDLGQTACAITDHGNMYGVVQFYKKAKDLGIKPIIGCEVYLTDKDHKVKENAAYGKYYHLILLAENQTGYANLVKLCTLGYTEGFYRRPRIDYALLEQYHEGLICLSACIGGELPKAILRNDFNAARSVIRRNVEIFGKDNYFLEIQDHGTREEKAVSQALAVLSREMSVPLVATADVHYTRKEDRPAHDALLCIRTNSNLSPGDMPVILGDASDPRLITYAGEGYYLQSEDEMRALFPAYPEAIENTQKIADRCNVEFEFHKTKMPAYKVPEGYTAFSYLEELCLKGMEERYPGKTDEMRPRIEYELDMIRKMGFVEYFLIVWDFIHWAKTHGVPVGPGRGSAAGSCVAYAIGITDIDPIEYGLLFERFLNPERVSMPDIDVDFCMANRHKVVEYVQQKYGTECVCQIITFGTFAARQILKDVGKCMGLSVSERDAFAKLVPEAPGITLAEARKMSGEFDEACSRYQEIYKVSCSLEGLPRQTGTHAAGVIICDRPVSDYIPLSVRDGQVQSQFNMVEVEELGLLKMDFLGLRTLTAIEEAKRNIRERYGAVPEIKPGDQEVFRLISTGKTKGIFQLESQGIQSFMQDLKPTCIGDLIAGVALYRPGPMDFIPDFVRGKNDASNVHYMCPQLEPILKNTYGCIVYQEQVMQIFQSLAGYSLGRADIVRRAMSKKKASVLNAEKEVFIYGDEKAGVPGCVKNGIPEEAAKQIFHSMEEFARYAFNKCVSGDTVIVRPAGYQRCRGMTVAEMYKVAHDAGFAKENGYSQLREEFLKEKNYGPALSMYGVSSVKRNVVCDIQESGVRPLYRVTTESGKYIECTSNHKFPTMGGVKTLSALNPGDALYAADCSDGFGGEVPVYGDKIVSIEFVRTEMAYDVTMADPAHNFVANNGIVTCNSHAAAYANICYDTAWLMRYYPTEYFAALMTSVITDKGKVAEYAQAAKEKGIKLCHVDINHSESGFTPVNDSKILFAIGGISNIGSAAAEALCHNRTEDFPTFRKALEACKLAGITSKGVEMLAYAGAFAAFGGNRRQYALVAKDAMAMISKDLKEQTEGQLSLFGFMGEPDPDIELPELAECAPLEKCEHEKEACGMYVSERPLDSYRTFCSELHRVSPEYSAGVLKSAKRHEGKNGTMAFVSIELESGEEKDYVVFPNVFSENWAKLMEGFLLVFKCGRDNIIDRVEKISDYPVNTYIRTAPEAIIDTCNECFKIAEGYPGKKDGLDELRVYSSDGKKICEKKKVTSGYFKEEAFLNSLRDRFGNDNVILRIARGQWKRSRSTTRILNNRA